jgi:hypothetical protein
MFGWMPNKCFSAPNFNSYYVMKFMPVKVVVKRVLIEDKLTAKKAIIKKVWNITTLFAWIKSYNSSVTMQLVSVLCL